MDGNALILCLQNGLETASKVGPIVGAIFAAIFLRKNTKDVEFEKLKAGKFREVADRLLASGYMTYTEFYKAANFLHVAELADQVFKHDYQNKADENQKYDFDWYMRFYDIVGNISDEEMQALWARILAGEIHRKGTYSLQLLDILKNFTQKQAELFNRVCSHCFISGDNVYIPNDNEYLQFANITYQDILDLDALGLINSGGTTSLSVKVQPDRPALFGNDMLRMVIEYNGQGNATQEFSFLQFPFTSAGRELITLIGKHGSEKDFLYFVKLLIKKNPIGASFVITPKRVVVKDNSIWLEKIDLESDARD